MIPLWKRLCLLLEHIKPTGMSTWALLRPSIIEDSPYGYTAAERGFSFLTNAVTDVDLHQAAIHLKFVVGHKLLPTQITNEFDCNVSEEIMIPHDSKCTEPG